MPHQHAKININRLPTLALTILKTLPKWKNILAKQYNLRKDYYTKLCNNQGLLKQSAAMLNRVEALLPLEISIKIKLHWYTHSINNKQSLHTVLYFLTAVSINTITT